MDIKELQIEVQNLTKTNKTKEKEIFKLNQILENIRTTLTNEKSEQSKLKICKSKLESEIRKLN